MFENRCFGFSRLPQQPSSRSVWDNYNKLYIQITKDTWLGPAQKKSRSTLNGNQYWVQPSKSSSTHGTALMFTILNCAVLALKSLFRDLVPTGINVLENSRRRPDTPPKVHTCDFELCIDALICMKRIGHSIFVIAHGTSGWGDGSRTCPSQLLGGGRHCGRSW